MRFRSDPSRQLKLVGITGTNGKTTTVTLLYDLFRGLGYKLSLIHIWIQSGRSGSTCISKSFTITRASPKDPTIGEKGGL